MVQTCELFDMEGQSVAKTLTPCIRKLVVEQELRACRKDLEVTDCSLSVELTGQIMPIMNVGVVGLFFSLVPINTECGAGGELRVCRSNQKSPPRAFHPRVASR